MSSPGGRFQRVRRRSQPGFATAGGQFAREPQCDRHPRIIILLETSSLRRRPRTPISRAAPRPFLQRNTDAVAIRKRTLGSIDLQVIQIVAAARRARPWRSLARRWSRGGEAAEGLAAVETALDPGAMCADSGVVGDGTVRIRFDGITASAPMTARRALASKALSAGRAPPARPTSRVSASLTSPRWPAVATVRSGRPNPSAAPWRDAGAPALAARRAARSGLSGGLPDKSAGGAARR